MEHIRSAAVNTGAHRCWCGWGSLLMRMQARQARRSRHHPRGPRQFARRICGRCGRQLREGWPAAALL